MATLKTPATRVLGIRHPVAQAGMGGATSPDLVAAVSNAGGLGILGALGAGADDVRAAIRRIRALTSAPFAVNHVLQFARPEVLDVCFEEGVTLLSLAWG